MSVSHLTDIDVLVVTKLNRLVRSVVEIMGIIQAMDQKQVAMRILNLGMDTRTPTPVS
jgi:DNA invertase Pin-like site-specific DNA recombinase